MSLGIIGCGSLGTAILQRLLNCSSQNEDWDLPQHFIVNVRSESSVSRLEKQISKPDNVRILQGRNEEVANDSDVVILGCPPGDVKTVLSDAGVQNGLKGKLLISLAAGVTLSSIESAANPSGSADKAERIWVVRAMPNLAVTVGKSATGIEMPNEPLPEPLKKKFKAIFGALGYVNYLSASQMDACTTLCGSTPAFIALFVDALIDGAVVSGFPRSSAQAIAVQTLEGTAALLLQGGQPPSALREEVCAQPGCTIAGIMSLEQGGARGVIAKAMADAIKAAKGLA